MNNILVNLRNTIGVDVLQVLVTIFGIYMLFTGFLDAYKYHWQCQAIKKVKLAKGHSRKFINAAIHNDHIKIIYLLLVGLLNLKFDWFLIISGLIAIIYMTELFFVIYHYYPYRMRGCSNFKKPNVILYLINSLTPNSIRKKL